LTWLNDNVSVPRGHRLRVRLRVALTAALFSAAAGGQEPTGLPRPCPPDSDRDALLASDLAAAAQDPARAADLLAAAAESATAPLWPTDWLVLARRDESRGDFAAAAARYRKYEATLEGSGDDTRWVEPRVKLLELAAQAAPAPSAAPEARLALADGRAALARGDVNAGREKLGYAVRLDPGYADAAMAASA
jgi:hypothetical protein